MKEDALINLLAAGVIAGLFLILRNHFLSDTQVKRKVRNHKKVSIADFVNGTVGKITGKAFPSGVSVVSPVSGIRCLYYRITVTERYSKQEIIHLKKKSQDYFVIQDQTGLALIRIKNAEEVYSGEVDYYAGFNTIPPANPAQFLADNYIVSKRGFEGNKDLVIREFLLKEGHYIEVVGKGEWVETSTLGLNLPVSRVLVVTNEPGASILITNTL